MRWREGVTAIKKKNGWYLVHDGGLQPVAPQNHVIIEALERGICENRALVRHLSAVQDVDEIAAGLLLAQFMIDHMEYIRESGGAFVIEP